MVMGDVARDEDRRQLAAEQAADEARQEAQRRQFEAEWQTEMEKARRAAEDLRTDAAFYEERANAAFDISTDQLEAAYGEGGTEWQGYENLVLQNVSTRGQYAAQAGASGLQNTGSVAGMANQIDLAASRSEGYARRGIEANMNAGIAQTNEALRSARFQVGEMREQATELETDWAGFDWATLTTPAAEGTAQTMYQRMYQAGADVMQANFDYTRVRYQNAFEELQDDFWNMGSDFLAGANSGFNISKLFGLSTFGNNAPTTRSLGSYPVYYSDPSYAYRGWG